MKRKIFCRRFSKLIMLEELLKKSQTGQKHNKANGQWLKIIIIAAVFLLLVLLVALCYLMFFELKYSDKFFPQTKIGQVDLSGLTISQALEKVEVPTVKIDQNGFTLNYQVDGQDKFSPLDTPEDPDLAAVDLLYYDLHQTVYSNFQLGHSRNFLANIFQQLKIISGQQQFIASYKLNEDVLRSLIKQQLQALEKPAQNARPEIKCSGSNCQISILPEQSGVVFDYDSALKELKSNLSKLENQPIKIKQISEQPEIKQSDLGYSQGLIDNILDSSSTEFIYKDNKWTISKKTITPMLEFQRVNGKIVAGINQERFFDWFKLNISSVIDRPAKNAALEIKDGKLNRLSTHQSGLEADKDRAYNDFNNKVNNNSFIDNKITITVNETMPEVVTEDVNDLGIKEIIGTGQSSFAGSPTNRRKNIKNGASKLHGLLIKPDEEFSLVKNLLPVDKENGYWPELVIKGNKTMPEYGGGLCQIGTTIFRAALASGLPILERQNHSYNVTYYLEGGLPGVDATIYDPKPDMRFKNDTGHYILIQSRIEGDKLYFDFWGTKDGRIATRTKPKVWGWKDPEPTKIIESTDLKPGEKKCTETSHKGVSASFNYIVTSANGQTATTTFTSYYKPWQAVCLVGVTATSSPETVIIP